MPPTPSNPITLYFSARTRPISPEGSASSLPERGAWAGRDTERMIRLPTDARKPAASSLADEVEIVGREVEIVPRASVLAVDLDAVLFDRVHRAALIRLRGAPVRVVTERAAVDPRELALVRRVGEADPPGVLPDDVDRARPDEVLLGRAVDHDEPRSERLAAIVRLVPGRDVEAEQVARAPVRGRRARAEPVVGPVAGRRPRPVREDPAVAACGAVQRGIFARVASAQCGKGAREHECFPNVVHLCTSAL